MAEEFLPVANSKGVATIGMKVLGLGSLTHEVFDEERLAFFKDIIPLVRPDKMPWKAKDWNNPTEWTPRHRGENNHS